MPTHDPIKFATGLAAKLASRSRHVCVFLGAGASRACGLPDVVQLQGKVLASLDERSRASFEGQLCGRNLEEALSRLRRISALLTDEQTVDGLTGDSAAALDASVCTAIVMELDAARAVLEPMVAFAAWAARAHYTFPLEVFTVNYDLLIETALDSTRVPYFDGFLGNLRALFYPELVDGASIPGAAEIPSYFVRLWKLHGSVNWTTAADNRTVRLGHPVLSPLPAAIYPSDAKYDESRRMPFVVLQDRFRRALNQPETLLLVAGYSFADKHLNESIFDAAMRRPRSEFIVMCFSNIPEILAEKAGMLPNLQVVSPMEAIIGGRRAAWQPPPAGDGERVWIDGKLILGDFSHLARYLAQIASEESIEAQ